jgi:hypothetical protein
LFSRRRMCCPLRPCRLRREHASQFTAPEPCWTTCILNSGMSGNARRSSAQPSRNKVASSLAAHLLQMPTSTICFGSSSGDGRSVQRRPSCGFALCADRRSYSTVYCRCESRDDDSYPAAKYMVCDGGGARQRSASYLGARHQSIGTWLRGERVKASNGKVEWQTLMVCQFVLRFFRKIVGCGRSRWAC